MSLKTYINKVMSDDDRTVDTQFLRRVLNRLCDDLDNKTSKIEIGNLSDLNTTAKTNIVAAINEAAQSGGSGAPVLKITLVDAFGKQFDNIAFTALAPSITQRTVSFAVEGQTVQSVSLLNTADADDYIDATSDGEGGFVATIPGKTATYFVEATLADNSIVSGVLFMNKMTA